MDDIQETRIMEPVPAEDEIRILAPTLPRTSPLRGAGAGRARDPHHRHELARRGLESSEGTMEWTAAQGDGFGSREHVDTPRVRHLFPVPEDADWEVRELDYDHYNRNAG